MSTTTNGSGPTARPGTAANPTMAQPLLRPVAPMAGVRSRRATGRWALGVGLVIVGALVAAWLLAGSSDRISVLTMARDVPYGQTITGADVTTADVLVDPSIRTIPAGDVGQVVGQVAATGLDAGSLVSPNQITTTVPPTAGQVLVPLPVPGNRLPAGGLTAGDRILVVDTPTADADPPSTTPATIAATVVRVGPPDLNGVSVLDVTVATGDGPALAARSVTGRFALVLQPAGGAR